MKRPIILFVLLLCSCSRTTAPPVVSPSQANIEGSSFVQEVPVEQSDSPAKKKQGRLTLIHAETDKTLYELGEPVRIRRVFTNPGLKPVTVSTQDWGNALHGTVGLTSSKGSGLYIPSTDHLPTTVIEPGEQIENFLIIELSSVGEYTIEVPHPNRFRARDGNQFKLKLVVVDRGQRHLLETKVERLGRVISQEDPSYGPGGWSREQNALEHMGPITIPYLRQWLRESESAHLRAVSAKLLWFVKGKEGIPDLVAGLQDVNPEVRSQCLDSLGSFKVPETLDAILPLIEDPDDLVQFGAVHAVSKFEDARVIPALLKALEMGRGLVRTAAATKLAERGDTSGIGHLIKVLDGVPTREAEEVVPILEKITGLSFGKPVNIRYSSSYTDQFKENCRKNEELARKWLEWWEKDGKALYGNE